MHLYRLLSTLVSDIITMNTTELITLYNEIKTRATQSVAYPLAYKFDPVTLTFDL
jgi:hypothetical protein